MLNMAPDKAADETTSFQCYPPVCLIIYRPTGARRAAVPLCPLVSTPLFLPPRSLLYLLPFLSGPLSPPSFFDSDFPGSDRFRLLLSSFTFEAL